MSQKATDPIKREEQARKYREMVAPYLGGEFVEAVGGFARTDDDPLGFRDSDIGMIVNVFTVKRREEERKKAEGGLSDLPNHFLLAITRDRVHAFSRVHGRVGAKVKGHVADFARDHVNFSSASDDGTPVGVIELTEEGRKGRVEVKGDVLNQKKNPWAAEVVAALEPAGLSE